MNHHQNLHFPAPKLHHDDSFQDPYPNHPYDLVHEQHDSPPSEPKSMQSLNYYSGMSILNFLVITFNDKNVCSKQLKLIAIFAVFRAILPSMVERY